MLISVYMPTDYGDFDCLDNYLELALKSKLYMMIDSDAIHLVIAGDFNCDCDTRFLHVVTKFANENTPKMTDIERPSDTAVMLALTARG